MRRYIVNWFPVIILFPLIACIRHDERLPTVTSSNYSLTTEFPESKGLRSFKCNGTTKNVFHCDEENCIPEKNRCNGIPECDNGEDELVRHCGCLPNEFRCTNTCIDTFKRCDRFDDCAAGEDEQNCVAHICPTTHFKCANHYCIPQDSHCNFRDDCGDNSDELNCDYRLCWFAETQCENGQCLRPGYLCDTIKDCEDNSDELECDDEHFVECGDGTRIHKKFWCDGTPECPDNHADELHCGTCDREDEYQCSNGRCIRKANVCDAHCDCVPTFTDAPNGTLTGICDDERNCDEFYSVVDGVKLCRVGVTLTCFHADDLQRKADRCIRREFICDGTNDCHIGRGLDEFKCLNKTEDEPYPGDGFLCQDGRLLPVEVHCDFKVDCLDGEDEKNCNHTTDPAACEATCLSGQCIPKDYLCDRKFQCLDKSDEMSCIGKLCPEGWTRCVTGGQCIQKDKWCDFYADCLDGLDEADCEFRDCEQNEFRCRNGQCINAAERCIHNTQFRAGCADGSHLLNCAEWTCPQGFYKCRRGPCINETLKCDNHPDCKQTWDDEDNCTRPCDKISVCQCRDIHINCSSQSLVAFPRDIEKEYRKFHFSGNQLNNLTTKTFIELRRIIFLDLSGNNITRLEPMIFQPLWMLGTLNLQNNRIRKLENSTFFGLSSLTGLHLQNNSIKHLCKMAFYGLLSLTTLSLRRQRISIIEEEAFVGLRSLTYLDLSGNEITSLVDGTFIGMPKLLRLDLSDNRLHLSTIGQNVFRVTVALEYLITDEFRFCCLARHVPSCKPLPDEFSSCEDLMTNIILRICVWGLGIVATFANLLVFAFRSLYRNSNKVHTFLIKNLALGDFLMGMYLLIIAFVDWHYRGMYFKYESRWRSSYLCNFAGFMSTFSSELTVFTLTVITLDRFLVIMFPFRMQRLEMNRTRILMFVGWVLAAVISVIPMPFFRIDYFRNFYGRSGVCLPLHITPDKPNGWEYSVFVFLFLNFLSFAIIAGSYLWMYLEARNTHRATQQRDAHSSESAMAFRMTLLVATDAACWIPIIILGVLSLAGATVPSQVFAWVAVFVLPLNAAINPVLYTLSTAPFMNPTRRNIKTLKKSFSRSNRRSYTSSALSYNDTIDCGGDEICSIAPHVPLGRWLRKVDTVVGDRGETVPLRRTRTINNNNNNNISSSNNNKNKNNNGQETTWRVEK